LATACSSDADPTPVSGGGQSESVPAPAYEARSFDDVKPLNVDLKLVPAPALPEIPDCNGEPRNVHFTLETSEEIGEIAPGITFPFLTFNGSVPGPAIVVCLGDWVEVTLKNLAGNRFADNVDFHAATGALGGGAASIVGPCWPGTADHLPVPGPEGRRICLPLRHRAHSDARVVGDVRLNNSTT
jgi:FtsP/CotA-like multicopper oxidase with cupredoxin domain